MAPSDTERLKNPAARALWAAICVLDEGDQHEVLLLLRERLAFPANRESAAAIRSARGVAALREAAELLDGRSPTVREYRELRETHPEREWPPDGSIRRWLGGNWDDALRQAALPAAPRHQPRPREIGPELTEEEAKAAIVEAAGELGCEPCEVPFQAYLAWARRSDVRTRPGRRPQSQFPFVRLFGSWRGALAAASGLDPSGGTVPAGASGQGYRYSDDELLDGVRRVFARLGAKSEFPSATAYQSARAEILAEERERGWRRALPSYNALQKRFRSWAGVKRAYRKWERASGR